MKLIGLAGYVGVGKNAIADHLGDVYQVSFAAKLKADLEPLLRGLGLDISKRRADKEKARELLVAYGKLARALNPAHWVQQLHSYLVKLDPSVPVVITDVRYLNEVLYVLNHGGTVFLIDRPGHYAANDEEAKSFEEIYQAWAKGDVRLEFLTNNRTPEEAASDLAARVGLDTHCRLGHSIPTVVPDGMPASVANRLYGESYGVDWMYPPEHDSIDAEAAVLAHPAWQKLQQYPQDFPAEKIEEAPHVIDLDACGTGDGIKPLEDVYQANLSGSYGESAYVQEYIAPLGFYFEALPTHDAGAVIQGNGHKLAWLKTFVKWLVS